MGGVNSFTRYRQLRIVACKKNIEELCSPRFTKIYQCTPQNVKTWFHFFVFTSSNTSRFQINEGGVLPTCWSLPFKQRCPSIMDFHVLPTSLHTYSKLDRTEIMIYLSLKLKKNEKKVFSKTWEDGCTWVNQPTFTWPWTVPAKASVDGISVG